MHNVVAVHNADSWSCHVLTVKTQRIALIFAWRKDLIRNCLINVWLLNALLIYYK